MERHEAEVLSRGAQEGRSLGGVWASEFGEGIDLHLAMNHNPGT